MGKGEGSGGHRVVVLRLGGVTFNLLMPLIKRGELLNLARLIEGGVHGRGEGKDRGQAQEPRLLRLTRRRL